MCSGSPPPSFTRKTPISPRSVASNVSAFMIAHWAVERLNRDIDRISINLIQANGHSSARSHDWRLRRISTQDLPAISRIIVQAQEGLWISHHQIVSLDGTMIISWMTTSEVKILRQAISFVPFMVRLMIQELHTPRTEADTTQHLVSIADLLSKQFPDMMT